MIDKLHICWEMIWCWLLLIRTNIISITKNIIKKLKNQDIDYIILSWILQDKIINQLLEINFHMKWYLPTRFLIFMLSCFLIHYLWKFICLSLGKPSAYCFFTDLQRNECFLWKSEQRKNFVIFVLIISVEIFTFKCIPKSLKEGCLIKWAKMKRDCHRNAFLTFFYFLRLISLKILSTNWVNENQRNKNFRSQVPLIRLKYARRRSKNLQSSAFVLFLVVLVTVKQSTLVESSQLS